MWKAMALAVVCTSNVVQVMWQESSRMRSSNALHLRQNLYKWWANSPSDDKATVQVLDESRCRSLDKGIMSDQFAPYQVHLYEIST